MRCKRILSVILIFMIVLTGCSDKIRDEITQNIVFICNRQQYSDNYYNLGYFIDKYGNKCYFDISDMPIDYVENISDLYNYLNQNYDNYEKVSFLNEEQLNECYMHLQLVNGNAEISEECVMTDYGSYYLYGARMSDNGSVELILFEEYGDWNRINTDNHVDEIVEIIGKDTWRDNL